MFSRSSAANTARAYAPLILGMLLVGGITWATFSVTVARGAATCSVEEVRGGLANGSIVLNLTDTAVTVTNVAGCTVPIRLDIYRVFRPDPPLLFLTQVPVDIQEPTLIQPGETKTITGNIPPCAFQIDVAYGPFPGPHLAGRVVTRGGFCPQLVNNASCVAVDVPRTVPPGQEFPARVTVQNQGTRPWHASPIITPHRLGSRNPLDNHTWGVARVELPVFEVLPGSPASFAFTARAPSTAGTYSFAFGMLEENLEHFGATCEAAITVAAPTPRPSPTPNPSPSPSLTAAPTTVNVVTNQSVTVNPAPTPTPSPTPAAKAPEAVTVSKTDDRETASPGQILTYRIVVRNPKDQDLQGVRIVDRLPPHLQVLSTVPTGKVDARRRTVTWKDQTISAFAEVTFAFRARVAADAPDGTFLQNAAEVNGPGLRGSATDTTTVVPGPAVAGAEVPTPTVSAPRPVPLGVPTGMDVSTLLLGIGGAVSGVWYAIRRNSENPSH